MITVWLLIKIACSPICGTVVFATYPSMELCLFVADQLAKRDDWYDLPTGYGCQEGQQEAPPNVGEAASKPQRNTTPLPN